MVLARMQHMHGMTNNHVLYLCNGFYTILNVVSCVEFALNPLPSTQAYQHFVETKASLLLLAYSLIWANISLLKLDRYVQRKGYYFWGAPFCSEEFCSWRDDDGTWVTELRSISWPESKSWSNSVALFPFRIMISAFTYTLSSNGKKEWNGARLAVVVFRLTPN